MAKSRSVQINEVCTLVREGVAVDEAAAVIRGVKIIGLESQNGRSYPAATLKAAVPLYEGAKVNIDHMQRGDDGKERSVKDGFGWLESVNARADGLYGNLHYLKASPLAPVVIESAQRNPSLFGFSHDARGKVERKDGRDVVTAIEAVKSVDLVTDPATTRSLFESRQTMTKTWKELCEAHPEALKKFAPLVEMEAMPADMAVEAPPEASPEEQLMAGFEAAVVAVFRDTSMDFAGKKSKIGELLKLADKATAKKEEPPAEKKEGDDNTDEAKESWKAVAGTLAKLQERLDLADIRSLLESKNIDATAERIAAYRRCATDAERAGLLDDLPKKQSQYFTEGNQTNGRETAPVFRSREESTDWFRGR